MLRWKGMRTKTHGLCVCCRVRHVSTVHSLILDNALPSHWKTHSLLYFPTTNSFQLPRDRIHALVDVHAPRLREFSSSALGLHHLKFNADARWVCCTHFASGITSQCDFPDAPHDHCTRNSSHLQVLVCRTMYLCVHIDSLKAFLPEINVQVIISSQSRPRYKQVSYRSDKSVCKLLFRLLFSVSTHDYFLQGFLLGFVLFFFSFDCKCAIHHTAAVLIEMCAK